MAALDRLVGQNRSRRPLNGVVLLVDMSKLFTRAEKERRDLALVLRARLTELGGELGTRLPLYVVMSKFDLLEGFEELFAKLPAREREQVQGFTFTLASVKNFDAWMDELGKAYQRFIEHLGDTLVSAIEAMPPAARKRVYALLRELSGGHKMLLRFLGDVLGSDRYTTPALVRGLYFSSVYQRGEVRNLLADASARAFAFSAPALTTKPQGGLWFTSHSNCCSVWFTPRLAWPVITRGSLSAKPGYSEELRRRGCMWGGHGRWLVVLL